MGMFNKGVNAATGAMRELGSEAKGAISDFQKRFGVTDLEHALMITAGTGISSVMFGDKTTFREDFAVGLGTGITAPMFKKYAMNRFK